MSMRRRAPQKRFPAATFEQYLTSIEHFADVTRRNKVEEKYRSWLGYEERRLLNIEAAYN